MNPDRLALLHEVADAVAAAFAEVRDFGPSGNRDGQYALDVVADEAALAVLRRAGVGVLSEESGLEAGTGGTGEVVIIDPIDGSTNAARGVPWFATAMCLVDSAGPQCALVVNQASGVRYWAVRGGGAWCDGVPLVPSGCRNVGASIVALNGLPPRPLGYRQSRVFGAVALDLCLVAAGVLDGYVDCIDPSAHGVWDYAASTLICEEAGVPVVDLHGRDLIVLDPHARRTPVAAATPELLDTLLVARRWTEPDPADHMSEPSVPRSLPDPLAGERDALRGWLEFHRATFARKLEGIAPAALAGRSVAPSDVSLLGLLRHHAEGERWTFQHLFRGDDDLPFFDTDDFDDFAGADDAFVATSMAKWQEACEESRRIEAAAASLDQVSAVAGPWAGTPVSLRWLMLHTIEEYARHNGHADLLRERIDGITGW